MKNLFTEDRNNHKKQELDYAIGHKGLACSEEKKQSYSLINEDISLPAAVIKRSHLTNNMEWMQKFANHHAVKLCPHGKTTMTPEFFRQQQQHGAWGITVASAPQVEVAAHSGIANIMMANQLVGKANMALIHRVKRDTGARVMVCVDSKQNVEQLQHYFEQTVHTIEVLIEYGVEGGRCGCRTVEEVTALAQLIATLSHVELVGIEVYEGVIHGGDEEARVRQFLSNTLGLAASLVADKLLPTKPIVTGAGSAWYDVVAEEFAHLANVDAILRPGCYVIHDTGIYLNAQHKVMQRAEKNQGFACELGGDLSSALEVWAYVISRPEATKAIIGLGKRDVAFDAGLPIPERIYRNGEALNIKDLVATDVMDQHTFLSIPEECDLQVGDMIAFSTSHPCLTFDKWRYIAISDDQHNVDHWVETAF
ncbi:amino acid deaminase [Vibrio sp. SCSIO 43140]|uniref:amino acid deaminase n=1 Tax=Vibrio sp. SCSIO 43140 TaxID=2819100 RepID=UPI0020752CE3|nr:amino acid deaminase [Vibrio sp. SCSIO 43140]USD62734.1 amino acid deaminase [Vibrio sp. SCSIO 43140]